MLFKRTETFDKLEYLCTHKVRFTFIKIIDVMWILCIVCVYNVYICTSRQEVNINKQLFRVATRLMK